MLRQWRSGVEEGEAALYQSEEAACLLQSILMGPVGQALLGPGAGHTPGRCCVGFTFTVTLGDGGAGSSLKNRPVSSTSAQIAIQGILDISQLKRAGLWGGGSTVALGGPVTLLTKEAAHSHHKPGGTEATL